MQEANKWLKLRLRFFKVNKSRNSHKIGLAGQENIDDISFNTFLNF